MSVNKWWHICIFSKFLLDRDFWRQNDSMHLIGDITQFVQSSVDRCSIKRPCIKIATYRMSSSPVTQAEFVSSERRGEFLFYDRYLFRLNGKSKNGVKIYYKFVPTWICRGFRSFYMEFTAKCISGYQHPRVYVPFRSVTISEGAKVGISSGNIERSKCIRVRSECNRN